MLQIYINFEGTDIHPILSIPILTVSGTGQHERRQDQTQRG